MYNIWVINHPNLMAAKLFMTIAEVAAKYPQFPTDRLKYEKRVMLESLQWRVDNPTAKNLSVRTSSIHRYFPYLDAEAVRTVQSAFRARFYDNKDDADYSEFWNEPALSQTFKDLDKTSNAITKALEEGELNGYFTAAQKLLPAEIVNEISMDYNGLIFKGKLKSEAHFYALIDAVRNF